MYSAHAQPCASRQLQRNAVRSHRRGRRGCRGAGGCRSLASSALPGRYRWSDGRAEQWREASDQATAPQTGAPRCPSVLIQLPLGPCEWKRRAGRLSRVRHLARHAKRPGDRGSGPGRHGLGGSSWVLTRQARTTPYIGCSSGVRAGRALPGCGIRPLSPISPEPGDRFCERRCIINA